VTGTLVETKFFLPGGRTDTVTRPRLTDLLSLGAGRLVLVSAPAGFGKTTLLGRWLTAVRDGGTAAAWVSLDEDDRSPASFWTYVITALDRAVPGVGAGALAVLLAGQAPVESVLATVLN
jgi:LuxR family maltose regulon positive regulatory protein